MPGRHAVSLNLPNILVVEIAQKLGQINFRHHSDVFFMYFVYTPGPTLMTFFVNDARTRLPILALKN